MAGQLLPAQCSGRPAGWGSSRAGAPRAGWQQRRLRRCDPGSAAATAAVTREGEKNPSLGSNGTAVAVSSSQSATEAPEPPRSNSTPVPAAAAAADPAPHSPWTPHYRTTSRRPINDFGFRRGLEARYELGEKLGAGTQGTVRLAVDRKTGKRRAIKTMPKQFAPDSRHLDSHFVRRVRNEIDIHAALGPSLNVCTLFTCYEDDLEVHLVLEQCSGGMLWDRIMKGKYDERQAARLVREVLRTVALCHAKSVMMRDIKPQNFLFAGPEEDAPLKAVDFGVAVFCRPGQYLTTRAGTRIIMAPEVVQQRYSLKADLWSAGILAYLLLTGRLPFVSGEGLYDKKQGYTADKVYNDILFARLDFESPPWDTLSAGARDFVQSLLQRDEALRPTAEEALRHPWLQEDGTGSAGSAPLGDSVVQRLQRFGTYGRLRQETLRMVASLVASGGITLDSILFSDLRGLFLELDPTDSGRVQLRKLQYWLEEGSFNLSENEAAQLLAAVDLDGDGHISFDNWVAAMMDWSKLHDHAEWDRLLDAAFDALDADGSGRIGRNDLELLLCGEEGCEVPDVLDSALREADVNNDGGVDREEFRRFMSADLMWGNLDLFEARLADQWWVGGGLSSRGGGSSGESSGDEGDGGLDSVWD